MKSEIHLSIIVTTFRRPLLLGRCLENLKAAVAETPEISIELAVIVNGDDNQSYLVAQQFSKKAPAFCKIKVQKSLRCLTPSEARNLLVPECSGSWIFFIDDDAFANINIFKTFLNLHERIPEAVVFGGPNLNPPESNIFQKASSLALASPLGAWASHVRYKKAGSRLVCGDESLILCNLFVKRNILGKKPFPSQFICCEENSFLQKRKLEGDLIIYDSDLFVWHERRSTPSEFFFQVFKYGYGRGQFLRAKRATHFYYWVPVMFNLYLLLLVPALFFSRSVEPLFPLGLYFTFVILSVIESLFRGELFLASLLSAAVYPIIHVAYGWGLVNGFSMVQRKFELASWL